MRSRSEVVGWFVTGIYLIGVVVLVYWKRDTFPSLGLNEIGDFLAGAFGPLAFLWLILGFLQQGRELNLSSKALQLQADELKNSVEQQTIMAQAALQQIDSQRLSLEFQQREFERSIAPLFKFDSGARGGGHVGKPVKSVSRLINSGQEVTSVLVLFYPAIGGNEQFVIPTAKAGSHQELVFNFEWPSEDLTGICTLSYMRSDGRRISENFTYSIPAENPFVLIERVLPEG
jgi:hypothetical protein